MNIKSGTEVGMVISTDSYYKGAMNVAYFSIGEVRKAFPSPPCTQQGQNIDYIDYVPGYVVYIIYGQSTAHAYKTYQ